MVARYMHTAGIVVTTLHLLFPNKLPFITPNKAQPICFKILKFTLKYSHTASTVASSFSSQHPTIDNHPALPVSEI